MPTLTESYHAGEFLISEAQRHYSREGVIVASGADLKAGTVLGRIVATHVTTRFTGTANAGAITMDATTPLLPGVKEGRYTAVCIEPASDAGQFEVFDPDGVPLGLHTVAGAAFANQIKFAIADGSGNFVAGDIFEIFVRAGTIAKASGTGDGAVTLYQTGEGCAPGVYRLIGASEAANGGTFTLSAPDGTALATVTVGTRFVGAGLDFLVADGANDWDIGDVIEITVGRGKVKAYNPANVDGSGSAWGILWADAPAASAEVKAAAIVREAEVNINELVWFANATGAHKATGLAELARTGIIGRA